MSYCFITLKEILNVERAPHNQGKQGGMLGPASHTYGSKTWLVIQMGDIFSLDLVLKCALSTKKYNILTSGKPTATNPDVMSVLHPVTLMHMFWVQSLNICDTKYESQQCGENGLMCSNYERSASKIW